MLVLSREEREEIVIADGLISVHVVDIRGHRVRLGIVAPPSVAVHRREVFDAIVREGTRKSETRYSPPAVPIATVLTDRELILEFRQQQDLRAAFESGLVRFDRKGA